MVSCGRSALVAYATYLVALKVFDDVIPEGGIAKTGVEANIGNANGLEGKLQEVVCNPVKN